MAEREPTPTLSPQNPLFLRFKNDILTVSAEAPMPPGSRVELSLPLHRAEKTVNVSGKITTVRRLKEREFEMAVRLHTVGREERTALLKEQGLSDAENRS